MNTNVKVLITCGPLTGLPVSGCSSSTSADQTPSQPGEGQASRVHADEVCMFADETNPTVSFRNTLFIMPTTKVSRAKERVMMREAIERLRKTVQGNVMTLKQNNNANKKLNPLTLEERRAIVRAQLIYRWPEGRSTLTVPCFSWNDCPDDADIGKDP